MALKKFDSINVIPLVDIMLVLLAIVLTTSTLIEKKLIPLNLPKAKSATEDIKHKSIAITINKDGSLFIEKKEASFSSFQDRLKKLDRNSTFLINCDKEAPFKSFVRVIDTLKSNNYNNIAIVSQANE